MNIGRGVNKPQNDGFFVQNCVPLIEVDFRHSEMPKTRAITAMGPILQ
ncbi:hypothetical protein PPOP_0641 [Paenibacillus popilliae ATCC 14706]|uniref:Uncharacterized protein n=1 Tax=Paenibacillus popilliae ATCC 14706 TaxID=1212764 RepID=M9LMD8_PAEPP|nr:hypothetical protein PPOP_0641 [Paenibacillus popilliae ATCC 14706]